MSDLLPPPPISQDLIHVERVLLPSGQVETKYVDAAGNEVGLSPTYHLNRVAASYIPPPVVVAVLEAEEILAEEVADSS